MERVKFLGPISTLLAVLATAGCASKPEVRYVPTACERPQISRPRLAIEDLSDTADAAAVFKAYELSLYTCVGYAKQLEQLNK